MPVLNSATEELFATAPLADERDVDRAVATAREAFPEWSRRTQTDRSAIVNRITPGYPRARGESGTIEMLDHGMPIQTFAARTEPV